MHIEITGEAERAIQEELSSGRYTSAQEVIAAMVQHWSTPSHIDSRSKTPQQNALEFEAYITKKGIRPFSPDDPRPDFWPEDESVDDFIAFIREIRGHRPATPE